jgi:hypothetical protein
MTERCIGCHAEVQMIDGPVHRYMTSAPQCWQRYGELLGVLYSQPAIPAATIMCADTYAVQHPGTPNPQAIQSVAIHLLNLYDYLVHGRPVQIPQKTFSERAFHSIAAPSSRTAFWLEPPSFAGTRTVFDMPLAETGDALARSARAWAESVWTAWTPHHSQVADWYAKYANPTAR